MKNKKIILGLGTITALGAMSVGFIACVKEAKVKEIVNGAGYSKLTEDQIKKIVKDIIEDKTKEISKLTKDDITNILNEVLFDQRNWTLDVLKKIGEVIESKFDKVSKLTEEQVKKLISENKDSKLLAKLFIETNKEGVQKIITQQLQDHLNKVVNDKNGKNNSDIGHFIEGKKEKDLINAINESLQAEGWTVVLSDTEKEQDKTLSKSDDKKGVNEEKSYTLKKTILGVEIKTKEKIKFNYSLGKFDLSKINKNILKGEVNSLEEAISQLNKLDQFKNNQITTNDVQQKEFTPATLQADGKIKISAKSDSEKFEKDITLTIPKHINLNSLITVKALEQFDKTTNPTEAEIITRLKEKNGNKEEIKSDNLTIENITSTGAKVKGKGIYKGEVDVTFSIKTPTP